MTNYGLTKITADDAIEKLNDDIQMLKVEVSEYSIDNIYLDPEIRLFLKKLFGQIYRLDDDLQGIKDILEEQKEKNERV